MTDPTLQHPSQPTQPRLAFLFVTKNSDQSGLQPCPIGVRYTRDDVRGLLQLIGVKPRYHQKVIQRLFQTVQQRAQDLPRFSYRLESWGVHAHGHDQVSVSLPRQDFNEVLCSCLAEFGYKVAPSADELKVASSLKERRRCVIVLLCGTSGSGKSTLASILASRLGISTVISTDSIRHMLRSFTTRAENPLLWASTYQAGDSLDSSRAAGLEALTPHERTIKGYKAQCEVVIEQLDTLIGVYEERRQSFICEGVHLSINFVVKLMQKHPSLVPFLVYIKNERKHVERMAVRARYMTLDPQKNRYVKNMKHIRWIQDYLIRKADKHLIPKVENTNVDRSVAVIHLTVMGCLKRIMKGEPVLDPFTNTARGLHAELTQVTDLLDSHCRDVVDPLHIPGASSVQQEASTSYTPPSPKILGRAATQSASSLAPGAAAATRHDEDSGLLSSDNLDLTGLLAPALAAEAGHQVPAEHHDQHHATTSAGTEAAGPSSDLRQPCGSSGDTQASSSTWSPWAADHSCQGCAFEWCSSSNLSRFARSALLQRHAGDQDVLARAGLEDAGPGLCISPTGKQRAAANANVLARQDITSDDEEVGDEGSGDGSQAESEGDEVQLQDYGSMYESAAYDDLDEDVDEEDAAAAAHGAPSSSTSSAIIRHLASIMARSKQRKPTSPGNMRLGHRSRRLLPALATEGSGHQRTVSR